VDFLVWAPKAQAPTTKQTQAAQLLLDVDRSDMDRSVLFIAWSLKGNFVLNPCMDVCLMAPKHFLVFAGSNQTRHLELHETRRKKCVMTRMHSFSSW